jgi:hypothetical protein
MNSTFEETSSSVTVTIWSSYEFMGPFYVFLVLHKQSLLDLKMATARNVGLCLSSGVLVITNEALQLGIWVLLKTYAHMLDAVNC